MENSDQRKVMNEAGLHYSGIDTAFLKVGDVVIWRGSWGNDVPKDAVVTGIRTGCYTGNEKLVERVPWNDCRDRDVIAWLDNGHWAYGYQLDRRPFHTVISATKPEGGAHVV